MATLKQMKRRRADQPDLFGGPAEPTVVNEPRSSSPSKVVAVTPTEISTDEQPPDRQPTASMPSRTVYVKHTPNERIPIDATGKPAAAGYITKTLLIVEVTGDSFAMPDMILCRFHADEFPAPTREAWRLSINLFDRVLSACVRAEAAWGRGEMADADYQTLRVRWAAVSAMYERLPRVWEWGTDVDVDGACGVDSV